LWTDGNLWVCGLAEWYNEGRTPLGFDTRVLLDDHDLDSRHRLTGVKSQRGLADLIAVILIKIGGPIYLDDLVTAVCQLGDVKDVHVLDEAREESRNLIDSFRDSGNQADKVERQVYLRRLWKEICALPVRQRTALLLGLKDPQGRELVTMLSQLRVASLFEIAEVLEMAQEKFTEIWNGLPIPDQTIADLLGCSRQQVVNLRLAARRRLARRMSMR
jgi:hypothetical protein